MDPQNDTSRCGFISILGLPNAGKSTLLNNLIGTKVSIVSRKVQTTRSRVLGIMIEDQTQIIMIDTPGVFKPKKPLEKAMVSAALDTISEADIVMHLVDCNLRDNFEKNKLIIDNLPKNKPCILALNKVDDADKTKLLDLAALYQDAYDYERIFMISGLKNNGTQDMLSYMAQALPKDVWLFPEDQITDVPMRMLAAELTREQIFDQLHEELPYSIFVDTEEWENFDNGSVKISQVIYVQKDSQKHIVIGKGGKRIKAIGQRVRKELEDMLETNVHVNLFVKVKKNWTESPENFRLIGLELPS